MGDTKLQDARYDQFLKQNPSASYDELASLPGDAVSQCVADEVLRTDVRRCVMIVEASKELVARWVQAQFRLGRSRVLKATEAPGPPRLCRHVDICGRHTLTQSQYCDFCCHRCMSSLGAEHNDYCCGGSAEESTPTPTPAPTPATTSSPTHPPVLDHAAIAVGVGNCSPAAGPAINLLGGD